MHGKRFPRPIAGSGSLRFLLLRLQALRSQENHHMADLALLVHGEMIDRGQAVFRVVVHIGRGHQLHDALVAVGDEADWNVARLEGRQESHVEIADRLRSMQHTAGRGDESRIIGE